MVSVNFKLLFLAMSFISLLHAGGFSCNSEQLRKTEVNSFYQNMKLEVAKSKIVHSTSQLNCIHECLRNCECHSVNLKEMLNDSFLCELIMTKSTSSGENLISARGWSYYELRVKQPSKEKIKSELKKIAAGYKSCADALASNNNKTTTYLISPSSMQDSFNISCEMRSDGVAMTVFHHDREHIHRVNGIYGIKGQIKHPLKYNVSIETIKKFVDTATSCRQYTYARCLAASFVGRGYCWLNDRNGARMKFWGGGPSNGTGCSCGITQSCDNVLFLCNCGSKLAYWGQDEGYVNKKSLLPITMMSIGDAHDMYYYIGQLECIHV